LTSGRLGRLWPLDVPEDAFFRFRVKDLMLPPRFLAEEEPAAVRWLSLSLQ